MSDHPKTPPGVPRIPSLVPAITAWGCALCGTTLWALWPTRSLSQPIAPPSSPPLAHATQESSSTQGLDLAAFRAPLWVVDAPPPTPPPAPEPPTPLHAELLALGTHDGAFIALLYDRSHDLLLRVREGDTLEGRTVVSISRDEIVLLIAGTVERIAVADPTRALPPAGREILTARAPGGTGASAGAQEAIQP